MRATIDKAGRLVIPATGVGIDDDAVGCSAMSTRGRAPDLLVDTSVAVALVVADREHHESTFRALGDRAGSAWPATPSPRPSRC